MNNDSNQFQTNTTDVNSTIEQKNTLNNLGTQSQVTNNYVNQNPTTLSQQAIDLQQLEQQVPKVMPSNSKSDIKNLILFFTIGIFFAVAVIAAIVYEAKDKNNDENIIEEQVISDEQSTYSTLTKGNIKFIKEYEYSSYNITLSKLLGNAPYITYINKESNKMDIIDPNGKILYTINDYKSTNSYNYLNETYISSSSSGSKELKVYNKNGEVQTFNKTNTSSYSIVNNILYYSDDDYTYAYNLDTKKEIWRHEGGTNPVLSSNNTVIVQKYAQTASKIILDATTGEEITNVDQIKDLEDDELKVYTTNSAIYYVYDDHMDIYDVNNNKRSSFTFTKGEYPVNTLETILQTGGYIIKRCEKTTGCVSDVYNIDGKLILTIDSIKIEVSSASSSTYNGGLIANNNNSEYTKIIVEENSAYEFDDVYLLFKDDTYIKMYGPNIAGDYAIGRMSNDCFLEDYEKLKIVNLNTKEEKILEGGYNPNVSTINGSYFIMHNEEETVIFDKDFNRIYGTSNSLYAINENFILINDYTTKANESVLSLYNINTKEITELDTQGIYSFSTPYVLVTYEFNGNKQWLYKFE